MAWKWDVVNDPVVIFLLFAFPWKSTTISKMQRWWFLSEDDKSLLNNRGSEPKPIIENGGWTSRDSWTILLPWDPSSKHWIPTAVCSVKTEETIPHFLQQAGRKDVKSRKDVCFLE